MNHFNYINKLIETSCQSDSIVLITGKTGTGKSTLAREIHLGSGRKLKPFVSINLATLHEGTFESELFGHEQGSFTGAQKKRMGRLECAHEGTVFLDEVGELNLRMQAKLLEFLQSKKIMRLGSNEEIKLDVRVIAATHRDLESAVKSGEFREDLFHRLRVIPIKLNSLCERVEEFDAIFHQCLKEVSFRTKKKIYKISEDVAQRMEIYAWPGNIRELLNVLEYSVLYNCTGEITLADLPEWFIRASHTNVLTTADKQTPLLGVAEVPLTFDYHATLHEFEKNYLKKALERYRGRMSQTAKNLGINKTTFFRLLKSHGILEFSRHLKKAQMGQAVGGFF